MEGGLAHQGQLLGVEASNDLRREDGRRHEDWERKPEADPPMSQVEGQEVSVLLVDKQGQARWLPGQGRSLDVGILALAFPRQVILNKLLYLFELLRSCLQSGIDMRAK